MKHLMSVLVWALLVGLPGSAQQQGRSTHQTSRQKAAQDKPAVPFDFRGIHLEMTMDEVQAIVAVKFPTKENNCGKYSRWSCHGLGPGVKKCGVASDCTDSEGGRDKAQLVTFHFVDDRLAHISYLFPLDDVYGTPFDNYSGIKQAATDKYGKPQSVSMADVQSKAGAHYKSEDTLWDNGVSTVELQQLCVDIDSSCLDINHKQLAQEEMKRVLAATKPEL